LEEAIYRFRNWLPWIPPEDPNHAYVADYLTFIQSIHFEDFGVRGLQEEHSSDSVSSGQPSFWDLIASLESPSMATEDQRLRALTSASYITDMAEIEQAIEPCRLLLASFHHSDIFKPIAVNVLGTLLHRAFWSTNNIEYVNEAISIFREGLNLPDAELFGVVLSLINLLSIRFYLCRSREDFDEIMQLYQMAANDGGFKIADRFSFSCQWAQLARIHGHPCTPTAYHYALSSMQDSLTFAPTADIQHSRLVAMHNDYETLPLDCASYHCISTKVNYRAPSKLWNEEVP